MFQSQPISLNNTFIFWHSLKIFIQRGFESLVLPALGALIQGHRGVKRFYLLGVMSDAGLTFNVKDLSNCELMVIREKRKICCSARFVGFNVV